MAEERTMLKRTGEEAELTEAEHESVIKRMKTEKEKDDARTPHNIGNFNQEDEEEVIPLNICEVKLEVDDEGTPHNISYLQESAGNRRSTSDDPKDEPILKNHVIHTRKVKYSGIVEECSKSSHIVIFVGNYLEIDVVEAKAASKSVCMPQLREFSLDASLDKKTQENLINYLTNINLEDFIFFYHDDNNPKNRLAQIWGKNINVTLKFSGVTVFHSNVGVKDLGKLVGELTMNYTKNSSFFSLNQEVLNNINILNLGNCEVDQKSWLDNEIAEKLVELRLFRVKGLDLEVVLRQCKSLKVLCVWAVENQVPTICLNDIASENLFRLSLTGYMIKVDPNGNNSVFPKCEHLCLVNQSCDLVFTEMMLITFPKLRKLSVSNKLCPPETDFLLKITSGSSLEEICVWNFEARSLHDEKVSELKSLVKNFDMIFKKCSVVENLMFRLKRKKQTVVWKGENVFPEAAPYNIFVFMGLDCFYSLEAFKKLIWANCK